MRKFKGKIMMKIASMLALTAAMSGCAATGELVGSVLGASAQGAQASNNNYRPPAPAIRRDTSTSAPGMR